jgi:hypothetical protein
MAINLSEYKAALKEGISRRNAYEVWIAGMPENIQLFIKNAQFPSMSSNPMNVYFQGRELKLAGMPRTQTWNVTIYGNVVESKLDALKSFWAWYDEAIGLYSNVGQNNPNNYWREIRIIPLADDRTTELAEFVLTDAFITEMQPVDISYESEDPLEFNTVIQFSELTLKTGNEVVAGPN